MRLNQSHKDYKWVILIVCFLMEFICLGFCCSNIGLYTKAVTEALGIKRSLYSLASSIRYIVQVFTALCFGTMVNRFGIKKMAFTGLVSLVASVLFRAFATNIYHLFIGNAFMGIGVVFSGGTMGSTIVRRWFKQDIGKYTGIVMSANGIGGAIAAQIITPIINNGETFGYRKAYLLSASVAMIVIIIALIFLRENPSDSAPAQYVKSKKKPRGVMWKGIEFSAVKRKPYFYATIVMVLLTGICLHSIGNITLVYLTDIGMDAQFVATTATVSSLCLTFTKMLVGITYDKKGLRFTLCMCLLAACLAFGMKAILVNSAVGMVIALTAALLTTFSTPLETVMIPLISNDLFGTDSYDKVMGILMAANYVGLCVGSPLADIYFDKFGTYRPCFWFFIGLLLIVLIIYQIIIRAAYKDKNAILASENTAQNNQ